MKSIYLNTIKWHAEFVEVDGSYYDHVAEVYSASITNTDNIRKDLTKQDFVEIKTNNGILVFEKNRYVVRVYLIY